MNLDRYNYFSNDDYQTYTFYSEGPKGKIKKVVRFSKINDVEPQVYNLGFGDFDEITTALDDSIISNNADRDKVLATVANTIVDFTNRYGNHYIYAEGVTASRTRLYQIGIANLWDEIKKNFHVYGLKDDQWHDFKRNVNYSAFLVKKK